MDENKFQWTFTHCWDLTKRRKFWNSSPTFHNSLRPESLMVRQNSVHFPNLTCHCLDEASTHEITKFTVAVKFNTNKHAIFYTLTRKLPSYKYCQCRKISLNLSFSTYFPFYKSFNVWNNLITPFIESWWRTDIISKFVLNCGETIDSPITTSFYLTSEPN